jgi:ligand-binding SRPBCC domain-containing protein
MQCWDFFSNPANLAQLTPPALDFRVLTDTPKKMHPGLMIEYRVRPILGIPMTWLTEITHVDEGRRFIDEQRIGPYRVWHHEHHFRDLDDSNTEMRDMVHYVLPLSPISELFHSWLVKPELEKIFDYRERRTRELFGLP